MNADQRTFTPAQLLTLDIFSLEYEETLENFDDPDEECRQAGKLFAATLAVVLDPESPRDCLGWREVAPMILVGIDLADERVQESVLAHVQARIRARHGLPGRLTAP